MKFLKENSDSIIKLLVNQMGIAIFSLFLYTAAGALTDNGISSPLVKALISAASLIFYFFLLYTATWEIGAKDKIRSDAGRLDIKPAKGLLLGFFANLINIAVWGIVVIFYLIYIPSHVEFFNTVAGILNFIFRLFSAMYLGIIKVIVDTFVLPDIQILLIESVFYLIAPILPIAVCGFGYYMGSNDKKIIRGR